MADKAADDTVVGLVSRRDEPPNAGQEAASTPSVCGTGPHLQGSALCWTDNATAGAQNFLKVFGDLPLGFHGSSANSLVKSCSVQEASQRH